MGQSGPVIRTLEYGIRSESALVKKQDRTRTLVVVISAGVGMAVFSAVLLASLVSPFVATAVGIALLAVLLSASLALQWQSRMQHRVVQRRLQRLLKAQRSLTKDVTKHRAAMTRRIKRISRSSRRIAFTTAALKTDVQRVNAELSEELRHTGANLANRLQHASRDIQRQARWDFHQLEALLNLSDVFDVRATLPASREFTASPDALQNYVREILERGPSLVVECGSGLSSIWAGYAAEACGEKTRVVALENDEGYMRQSRQLVAAHGLENYVEVRHAPIKDVMVEGESRPWYDPAALDGLENVGVLFVDGPIGSLADQARYPALPLFRTRLSPGAVVLLDDGFRDEESKIAESWVENWPELVVERPAHEKGTIVLHVPS